MGRITDTTRLRCLIAHEGAAIKQQMIVRASCLALDIDVTMADLTLMPADSTINSYDFMCIPGAGASNNVQAVMNNANITVPIFVMGCTGFNGKLGTNSGVTDTSTSLLSEFITFPWSDEPYFAYYGATYPLGTGTALATISAVVPPGMTTSGAQTNAGNVCMWSSTGVGGAINYFSSFWVNSQHVFPLLLQAAINDGELSLSGRHIRKAPMTMGMDHINMLETHTDTAIIEKVVSYIPAGGKLICGIYSGADDTTAIDAMPASLVTQLKTYSDNPFVYTYHEHRTGLIPASGAWPNLVEEQTKQEQYDNYKSLETIWNSYGLEFHEDTLYNSGANRFNVKTIELFSRDVSRMSSPGSDTIQAGLGFRMFRSIGASDRIPTMRDELFGHNQHKTLKKLRGISIVGTWDMAWFATVTPYDTPEDWYFNFRDVLSSLSCGMDLYIHTNQFIESEQEPGVVDKMHGFTAWQMYVDLGNHCSDLCQIFADPKTCVP